MEQVSSTSTNNKRIAKNTIFLYIRMGLSTIVSLYTSRVVLQTLGVEDYGIYSLVGGIVVMFRFLNSSLAGATSRFLTFELGKGSKERLKDTFSSALLVHIILAFVVLIVGETFGLWFFTTQLVIPEGRMFAAQIVYQCSIVSMMLGFTQTPYNASIISHEKMNIYAYIELLDVFLRLGIVFVLLVWSVDKLILYGILVLVVSATITLIYRFYAIRHYKECSFRFIWKSDILKPMLSFSGWNLYGQAAGSLRQFGTNSLINIFFGVVYNAAGGIAVTVNGVITGFAMNVITAFRPQIIKQFAQGETASMIRLMTKASKYTIVLFLVITIPLVIELPYLLKLWLGVVPYKTVAFIRLLLISTIPFVLRGVVLIAIHATGNIKSVSIVNGTLSLATLIPIYLLFKMGYDVETAYICLIVQRVIIFLAVCIILKYLISFDVFLYLKNILGIILFSLSFFYFSYLIHKAMPYGLFRVTFLIFLSILCYSSYIYFVEFDKQTRKKVNIWIKNKIPVKK